MLAAVGALVFAGPQGFEAGWLLAMRDEPAALGAHAVQKTLNGSVAQREIDSALAWDDPDLAESFAELARDRGISIEQATIDRIAAASSSGNNVRRFVHGFMTGESRTVPGFAGAAASDLLAFGDLRDVVREGSKLLHGGEADQVMLALAGAGLGATAASYALLGASAPARAGVTTLKAAYRTGRVSRSLSASMVRLAREAVDARALRRALSHGSLDESAATARAARAGLLRMAGDVGTIQASAGVQATFEGLQLARGPGELSRIARLAEKERGKTRAILKLVGRAGFMVTAAAFELGSWLLGAAFALLMFCASVKGLTERATYAYIGWKKRRNGYAYAA
jgi:hypothetical protein